MQCIKLGDLFDFFLDLPSPSPATEKSSKVGLNLVFGIQNQYIAKVSTVGM